MSKFRELSLLIIKLLEAGKTDPAPVSDADLNDLPPPVARYLKASGLVGMKRINFAS